jgi:integrase
MPLYLLNRQGTFYYHRRIPASILKANPSLKPVLRISLGTGRKSEAIKIAHRLNVMFDEFAKQYFQTPEEYTEAKVMLQRFEHATCLTCLSTTDINKFFEKYGSEAAEKIGKARRVAELQKLERIPTIQINENKNTTPGRHLSELIEPFLDNLKRKNGWKQVNDSEDKYRHVLGLLIDLVDKPANLLVKGDLVKAKDLFLKLPNIRKFTQYRGKSAKELYKINIPQEHTLSNNTIKQHADKLVTFLNWLFDNDHCSENFSKVFKDIVKTIKKEGKDFYTEEQLKVLFNPTNYKTLELSRYWIPLIALHTGARINEICQLDVEDIKQIGDVWVFDINEDDDRKSVKRESSKRIIPIHSKLLQLGLLQFVESRRGKKKLFNVTYTEKNGYAGVIGKWWIRWQKQCGIEDNVSFHSFRKTVINYFNQTLELPEVAHAYYTGHAQQGNEGIKTYTKEKPLPEAKTMFNKLVFSIDYDNLNKIS